MAINEKISIILNELAGNKIADEQKVEELMEHKDRYEKVLLYPDR